MSKRKNYVRVQSLVLAAVMILLCVGGATLGYFANDKQWFAKAKTETVEPADGETKEEDKTATDDTNNGGLVVTPEASESGIALTSAEIATEDYDEYGISTQADGAYTITATVSPSNTATNTAVEWTAAFQNPESEWASGKTVSDYVTVTAGGTDAVASKTCTVSCAQAFGEQILVTATVKDTDVKASCTLDYAQKVTGITALSFGDIVCNLGGETGVSVELNQYGTPTGGAAELAYTESEVYTLPADFTISYELSGGFFLKKSHIDSSGSNMGFSTGYGLYFGSVTAGTYDSNSNSVYDSTKLQNHSVAYKGLYFGIQYFIDNFDLSYYTAARQSNGTTIVETDSVWNKLSSEDMITLYENIVANKDNAGSDSDGYIYDYSSLQMFTLTVKVSSKYSNYSNTTTFVMNGYTNTAAATSASVEPETMVF